MPTVWTDQPKSAGGSGSQASWNDASVAWNSPTVGWNGNGGGTITWTNQPKS